MRITVSIKDETIDDLLSFTQTKNKTEAVNRAIEDFLKKGGKQQLLNLKGKLHLEENWQTLRKAELSEK